MFGYVKTELINRKVNTIMPELYSICHDEFIERYNKKTESHYMSQKMRLVIWGKHKTQYIFPTSFQIRIIPSVLAGQQVVAKFKNEQQVKFESYILLHADGTIDAITASNQTPMPTPPLASL